MQQIFGGALQKTERLLQENSAQFEQLVDALMRKETLDGTEVQTIVTGNAVELTTDAPVSVPPPPHGNAVKLREKSSFRQGMPEPRGHGWCCQVTSLSAGYRHKSAGSGFAFTRRVPGRIARHEFMPA